MGVLIYLPERPQASRGVGEPIPGPAQILFFTGVRYVRDEAAGTAGANHTTASTRRASDTSRDRRRRG
jgi:hypothetical protein